MKILLVCERSGGHIFPAMTFARKYIQTIDNQQLKDIYFFTTADFLNEYVLREGFSVCGKAFAFRNIAVEMIWRFFEAIWLLLKLRPKKVIGFGGRDSFFLVILSRLSGIETSIYEPNCIFGKANFFLAKIVKSVYCGFSQPKMKNTLVVGIPLRHMIRRIARVEALRELGLEDKPTVFCFGGSQGSVFLNRQMVRLAGEANNDFQVIHITGKKELEFVRGQYRCVNRRIFLRDFYPRAEILFSAADLIIARAGANTIAEISFYKIPVIFIPHPLAGGHQAGNAACFVQKNAGEIFYEQTFDYSRFEKTAVELLYNFDYRARIRKNMESLVIGIPFERFGVNTIWK